MDQNTKKDQKCDVRAVSHSCEVFSVGFSLTDSDLFYQTIHHLINQEAAGEVLLHNKHKFLPTLNHKKLLGSDDKSLAHRAKMTFCGKMCLSR